ATGASSRRTKNEKAPLRRGLLYVLGPLFLPWCPKWFSLAPGLAPRPLDSWTQHAKAAGLERHLVHCGGAQWFARRVSVARLRPFEPHYRALHQFAPPMAQVRPAHHLRQKGQGARHPDVACYHHV